MEPPNAIPEEDRTSAAPLQRDERASVVDGVRQLRDEVRLLRDRLEEERRRRQHLETIVRTHLLPNRPDIRWEE